MSPPLGVPLTGSRGVCQRAGGLRLVVAVAECGGEEAPPGLGGGAPDPKGVPTLKPRARSHHFGWSTNGAARLDFSCHSPIWSRMTVRFLICARAIAKPSLTVGLRPLICDPPRVAGIFEDW